MATTNKKNKPMEDAYKSQYASHSNANGITKLDEYKNIVNAKTSSLSNLNQANQVAMKYANTSALAQGYATQGASQQQVGNLQNAYLNQVGNVNALAQQQIGNLSNTASANAVNKYTAGVQDLVARDEFNQENLNKLQQAYYGQMSNTDIKDMEIYTGNAITDYNKQNQANMFKTQYGIDENTQGVSIDTILNSGEAARKILGQGAGGVGYTEELQKLIKEKPLQNGDTIKVKNNYYVFKDNQLIQTKKLNNVTYEVKISGNINDSSNNQGTSNNTIEIDTFDRNTKSSLTNSDNIGKVYYDKSTGHKWTLKYSTSYGLRWYAVE